MLIVSPMFGNYLFACISWLHLQFDDAFSSLWIANYKSFCVVTLHQHFQFLQEGPLLVRNLVEIKEKFRAGVVIP
jgi:hypothetical protein